MTEAEQKLIDAALCGALRDAEDLIGAVAAERIDEVFKARIRDIDDRQARLSRERDVWFEELSARMGGAKGDPLMRAVRAIRGHKYD